MHRREIKVACQTFTWEMLGEHWKGGPDDLLAAISDGGYSGIEITDTMIGHYKHSPQEFSDALEHHDLTLVAFAFGSDSGFTTRSMIQSDLDITNGWIEFVCRFPNAMISIGSATAVSDGPKEEKFEVAAEYYNQAAVAATNAGVSMAVHPSSHQNTLLHSREDYDYLFAMLDKANVGWVPDTGHILRGHKDLLDTMRCHRDRIRYLHLKDVDQNGRWVMLGQGVCDIPAVIEIAKQSPRFNGWIVGEEESEHAGQNPSAAVKENRLTLKAMGY